VAIARRFEQLSLSPDVLERLRRQRAAIDALVDGGEADLRTLDGIWFAGDDVDFARASS
jgi:hypothetical protein